MAKMTVDELIDAFKELSLMELSDFKTKFEDTFDVQAAAPAMMMAGGGDAGGAAEEEKDTWDVILAEAGSEKIKVIKEVRGLTGLPLKEAKDLVEGAPKPVLEGAATDAANEAKEKLEAVGAKVELK